MVEQPRAGEISAWRLQVDKLQRKRDKLVTASIPGLMSVALLLPIFIKEASQAIFTGESLKTGIGLAIGTFGLIGYVPFKLAEFAEQKRLKILGSLQRHGENIEPLLNAGKFPWVRKLFRGQVS